MTDGPDFRLSALSAVGCMTLPAGHSLLNDYP